MGKTVLETFTIFPFSIVLALALGEAFKQCVSEKKHGAIECNRLPALFTFLLLILPFYQGMDRYLLQTYGGAAAAGNQASKFLVIDGVAFMAESALFFAMSRNLSNSRWVYFYWIVGALLIVDTCWGAFALLHVPSCASATIQSWMILNVATCVGLLFVLWLVRRCSDLTVASVGAIAMFARTFGDYWISWDFYFGNQCAAALEFTEIVRGSRELLLALLI
jgi:hypothetical protein